MPIALTDEQRALQAAIRDWASAAGCLDTIRRYAVAAPTALPKQWAGLADLGVFSIHVPAELGGAGGSVDDLVFAIEQAAHALVPGPVLSTLLASLVLADDPTTPLAKEFLPRIATGEVAVGVALDASPEAVQQSSGDLRVRGDVGVVLGAGSASHLLLGAHGDEGEVWFLVDATAEGIEIAGVGAVDFSQSSAAVALDTVVPATRVVVPADHVRIRDLAATLASAEAAGIAGWCLETATEYAKVRQQFGRPIGSFQAIKLLCAEMLCRAQRAAAVSWDAAHALADGPAQHPLAAAVAASIALDAAVENAKDCIQVLGGIGFTWEHDAHLYLRRAIVLHQLLGGSLPWRRRTADLALSGVRRELHVSLGDEGNGTRVRVREFAESLRELPAAEQRVQLAESGYLMPHWPRPYGRDAGAVEQLIIDEELARAGVVRPDLVIGGWAVPTILTYGTDEQRRRFVMPTLRGDITWCQLFSEPEAGSDLASLRTRAVRVDGGWELTGQKVWSSVAHEADWSICLARTNADAPKHRGITYFLVDMRSPGIDVRPLRQITGDAKFNEVFLESVFVPDDCVVGPVDGGWKLARTTLANERVAMSTGSSLGAEVEQLLKMAATSGQGYDPSVRERLGELVGEGLTLSLLGHRTTLRAIGGNDPGPESDVRKLIGVRHRQAVSEMALELAGPGAVVQETSPEVVQHFLLTRCLSIAGGTTQVLATAVAERLLGLPRGDVR